MYNPTFEGFDKVVADVFRTLAVRSKSELRRIGEGVYEIEGHEFTTRIRRGTGHRKNILVTISPTTEKPTNLADLSGEIGLSVVAKFHGEKLTELSFDDEKEYLEYARNLANSAQKVLLPYLLGLRSDFSQIKEFVAKNAEESAEEVSKYRFPKNVRKEWI